MSASVFWAVVICVILFLIIYSYISSKIEEKKRKVQREKYFPILDFDISSHVKYNFEMNNGRKFFAMEVIGSLDGSDAVPDFMHGFMVLKNEAGKRIFIRQAAIRSIEEI
jgi:hypothetical protein